VSLLSSGLRHVRITLQFSDGAQRRPLQLVVGWLLDRARQHADAFPASGLGRPEINANGAKRTRA
jgi:hypothetical protein